MMTGIAYAQYRNVKFQLILLLSVVVGLIGSSATAGATEINIYSSRSPELVQPVLDAYSAETGVSFNVLYLAKGMAQRLAAEREASPADIVLTVDISRLSELDEMGVFAKLNSPVLMANIPAKWRDDDDQWIGLTTRARVAVISIDRVDASKLTRLEDLTDEHWKGRICTRMGSHPYNRALLASMVAHLGEEAALEWATGLVANMARKPQGNDRAQASAIYAGRCDVALMNTYYYGLMANNLEKTEQQDWAKATRIVFLNQGDGDRGQHVNISGAGILKSSQNYEASVQFLEWLSGPKGQSIYSSINYEYPVNPAVIPDAEIRSWGHFRADDLPITDIARHAPTAQRIINKTGW
jgi:iron(III) transport system substrate-binding protein